LKGIYFIGTNNSQICQRQMDATLLYEPVYTIFHPEKRYGLIQNGLKKLSIAVRRAGLKLPVIVSYRLLWHNILHRKEDRNVYYGGFADFDTSPRKGENGYVCVWATPAKFKNYFSRLYKKSMQEEKEFLFLTAWNEWGEGAYLEPDCKYGFQYLAAVRAAAKQGSRQKNILRKI